MPGCRSYEQGFMLKLDQLVRSVVELLHSTANPQQTETMEFERQRTVAKLLLRLLQLYGYRVTLTLG